MEVYKAFHQLLLLLQCISTRREAHLNFRCETPAKSHEDDDTEEGQDGTA
jgi:hypothetical protein